MRYSGLFGWGIVIYSAMFLTMSILGVWGLAGTLGARLTGLLMLIVVTSIAGRSLHLHSWIDILPYSVGWLIIVGLLDASFVVALGGWGMYADWNLWVGYSLVVLVPLIAPYQRSAPELP